ncbi:hypothetical protein [Haladaptatus sp. DYF46]|uniref:hypothetical protein n=1 Tax=Haladaptatus sp. DYF46 TaxID=2886041 RepID=UPI001E30AFDA|nr:hypothetical protein [Haladaptatus sp. DYF46]
MTDQQTVLALECTDTIQIHTKRRTLMGIVYQCEHSKPTLSCRGPEPGEHVLYVTTPSNDLYRLQYCYYDEYENTEAKLDQYGHTPSGNYAWLRTHATVECIVNPTGGEQA